MTASSWTTLVIAGFLEIIWAVLLKSTSGFTKLYPSMAVLTVMGFSFYFLSQALRGLPVGTAYAVWTGIGAVGTAVVGAIIFKEPFTAMRAVCILLIVTGIFGLKFFS